MDYDQLSELASEIAAPDSGLEVKDRKYLFKTYPDCFIGSECVDWLVKTQQCARPAALALGMELQKAGFIQHVVEAQKPFLDGYFFYFFTKKVKPKKAKLKKMDVKIESLIDVLRAMLTPATGIDVKDRKYHFRKYPNCFVAHEAVDWMLQNLSIRSREEGEKLGDKLVLEGYVEHVVEPQAFRDAYLFFRFTQHAHNRLNQPEPEEEEIVSQDDFETLSMLGEGGYGKVTLVRKIDTQVIYAMKVLDKSKFKTQKAIEHLMTEKRVLRNNSPFLLHLKYSFQTPSQLFLVTDFLGGGDLFFHLAKRQGEGFPLKISRFFTAEMIIALEHLHQAGVVYRDLKLENVLLDNQGHICLADFGLSKELDESDSTQTFCGSQGYLAPEILRAETYSYAVDWFSLGVIVYEMMTGTNPFLGVNFHETCRNILQMNPDYSILDKTAASFVKALLEKDPAKRLSTAAEAKRHPFFKPLDWNKISTKKYVPPFKITLRNDCDLSNFDKIFTGMKIDDVFTEESSDALHSSGGNSSGSSADTSFEREPGTGSSSSWTAFGTD